MGIARAQLEERVVSLYKDGYSTTSSEYLEVFFAETDIVSVLDRFDTIGKMADQDQQLFDEVGAVPGAVQGERNFCSRRSRTRRLKWRNWARCRSR